MVSDLGELPVVGSLTIGHPPEIGVLPALAAGLVTVRPCPAFVTGDVFAPCSEHIVQKLLFVFAWVSLHFSALLYVMFVLMPLEVIHELE
jgi:hypothetical protein